MQVVKSLIEGGTLIDGTGRPPEEDVSLLVEGGVIKEIGRKITKTWAAFVFIDERQEDAERIARNFFTNQSRTSELLGLIGTPENIAQRLHEYVDRGATHFILSFLGRDFEKEAPLFMNEVVPSI